MVNVPQTRRIYRKGKKNAGKILHAVSQYKAGKASLYTQGKKRYDRKQSGYGVKIKQMKFHDLNNDETSKDSINLQK
uniref:Uncharacterized protein n=1 Tax=Octopus bimaculoides TaxID=37653 RepID=A0A0L8IEK7_OCTBM